MATRKEATTERVVFIEFKGGRPFTVMTVTGEARGGNEYAVDWCRRDHCLYYHDAGGGPGRVIKCSGVITYWAAPGYAVEAAPGSKRVKRSLWKERLEEAFKDGGAGNIHDGRCEYCPACNDHLPVEDDDSPCDHIWWCEESGDYSRPGDRCPWDCAGCRSEGRETRPAPPILLVAQGYGLAASLAGGLAAVTRDILASRGLTPERLRCRMGWCSDVGKGAIAMALRGEVHPSADAIALCNVADTLDLNAAERRRLFDAFSIEDLRDYEE